jgi:hypothetical protein
MKDMVMAVWVEMLVRLKCISGLASLDSRALGSWWTRAAMLVTTISIDTRVVMLI